MENAIKVCSFDNWYDLLRQKNETVRSEIIPLPDDFIQFLLSGEFLLEDNMFPDLEAKVKDALRELGGHAFAKLNFTAPTDAQWIGSQRTLEIQNFKDVIYILKASTRVLLDITLPFGFGSSSNVQNDESENSNVRNDESENSNVRNDESENSNVQNDESENLNVRNDENSENINENTKNNIYPIKPVLVLKKYFDYRRDREFRVFQRRKGLRFISSRYDDVPCHIEHENVEKIVGEFVDHVSDLIQEEKLIFDVYISPKMRTHLIDVAPWNEATSSAMFTWAEIEEMNENKTLICTECKVHPVEDPPVPAELTGGASLDEIIEAMKKLDNL